MTRAWVIGAGGLLGQSVGRNLPNDRQRYVCPQITWGEEGTALDQIRLSVSQFFEDCGSELWQIYWCAGRGTVLGDRQEMQREVRYLEALLQGIETQTTGTQERGTLVFSSSAGAVYGGGGGGPYSESSPVTPYGPYGEHKVRCEDLLNAFTRRTMCRVAICRISNLYGPNQDLSKGQGLISTLTSAMLMHHPAPIYVPLDTVRNVVFVDDAARKMIGLAGILSSRSPKTFVVKNICASHDVSIAMIVHQFARVFGRKVPIVGRSPRVESKSPRSIRVCSVVEVQLDQQPEIPLEVGISALRRSAVREL